MNKKFSFRQRLKSFTYAFQGLQTLWSDEHNSRIHVFFALMALVLGFYFDIERVEWMFLVVVIAFVFVAEILNTSIENLCDALSTEINPRIEKAKDLGAAAVLLSSLAAVVVGLFIFLPYVAEWIK